MAENSNRPRADGHGKLPEYLITSFDALSPEEVIMSGASEKAAIANTMRMPVGEVHDGVLTLWAGSSLVTPTIRIASSDTGVHVLLCQTALLGQIPKHPDAFAWACYVEVPELSGLSGQALAEHVIILTSKALEFPKELVALATKGNEFKLNCLIDSLEEVLARKEQIRPGYREFRAHLYLHAPKEAILQHTRAMHRLFTKAVLGLMALGYSPNDIVDGDIDENLGL